MLPRPSRDLRGPFVLLNPEDIQYSKQQVKRRKIILIIQKLVEGQGKNGEPCCPRTLIVEILKNSLVNRRGYPTNISTSKINAPVDQAT